MPLRLRRVLPILVLASALPLASQEAAPPRNAPYRNPSLSIAERVADLIPRMTLEEKFWQLFMIPGSLDDPSHDYSHGAFGLQISADTSIPATQAARAHAERVNAIQRHFVERTRLGIPIIPFDEALHGLMREGALVYPQAIGMAASWDSALVARVSETVARETRARGVRMVLSPVVNIASDVRWGRVEETFGEDGYLTGVMGRNFVRAFESAGIITTPKHLVANVGEGGRDSYPIDVSTRMLHERFLPPFRSLITETGARSVMTAYNSVDGLPATQNGPLLNGIVKGDWGFKGIIISDAAATGGATVLHFTEASTATATQRAYAAGLDVVFQSEWPQHRPYLEAFRRGLVSDSVMNAAVARVLRAKFELGLFERPYVDPDSAGHLANLAASRALARDAARRSLVLLRNKPWVLPLHRGVPSIAVIGPDAVEARSGGYSGRGVAPVSILDAIRAAVPTTKVTYAEGPGRLAPLYVVVPSEALSHSNGERAARGSAARAPTAAGLRGEYFANNALSGTPTLTRTDAQINFGWTLSAPARGIPFDWYSVRWTGRITVPQGGVQRIGVEANDGFRLWIDGNLTIDNWEKRSAGTTLADVQLLPGSTHEIRLEYFESTGNARVRLIWDAGVPSETDYRQRIRDAAAAATEAAVAVVVAGVEEGEFRDRASLRLPGRQEDLIRAVSRTGAIVVVIIVGGSAVTMSSWLDQVDAVLFAGYPGDEGGNAIADVLFGDANPAGRLPITFPVSEGQLPLTYDHKPTGRGDDYVDLTGHPLFPFGYGLSYTTFAYSGLRITPDTITADGSATVYATIRNTGPRAGDEVVQLYIRDLLATVARPVQQLAGFTRITLAPGESREVSFRITRAQLQMLDANLNWLVEPGRFRIQVGASSRDIRLRGELVVR
ncbi:MAG: glycoside hydrolase family 3 C-terminal domain-containing protein [Gemmatimonadaceae bacterium]|nr:glycoside hydrolase family 3 C-terminal domain-containing protein [Gemmatimonadaceae bacterium]